MSNLSDDILSEFRAESSSSVLEDIRAQAQQINWLQSRFKILVSEAVKTQESLNRCEGSLQSLQKSLVSGVDESISGIKHGLKELRRDMESERVGRADLTALSSEMDMIRGQLDDLRFAAPPSGAFSMEPPSSERLSSALAKIEQSIMTFSKMRTADVNSINQVLAKLDARIAAVATNCCCQQDQGVHGTNFQVSLQRLNEDFGVLARERLPDIEEAIATRMRELNEEVISLRADVRMFRDERDHALERTSLRDTRFAQILSLAEHSKALTERSESAWIENQTRLGRLEADLLVANSEISRLGAGFAGAKETEERIDLLRGESRAQVERMARQIMQEMEGIREKVDRVAILKDEYLRVSEELRSVKTENRENFEILRKVRAGGFGGGGGSLGTGGFGGLRSTGVEDARVGHLGEGVSSASPSIPPVLPSSTVGEIEEISDSAVKWVITDINRRIMNPIEYPKSILSPYFRLKSGLLTARLKLFACGSEQSRKEGYCSLYLRCSGGTQVRFSLSVNGEPLDTFECFYDSEKDKGKHDFCSIEQHLLSDGSLVFGLQVFGVKINGKDLDN